MTTPTQTWLTIFQPTFWLAEKRPDLHTCSHGGDYMDVTRVVQHDKRLELQVKVQRPWTRLTDEDISRLNNKREELITILRQWHHYSRMQADRIISDWLFRHS